MNNVTLEDRLDVRNRPAEYPQLYQEWQSLLFLHWEYDAEMLQKSLPSGLFVDTFEGKAYLSVVAFLIRNQSIGFMPSLPGLTNYIEINLRTYVYDKNRVPGVWFYSLDIDSFLAQEVGRRLYQLPYHLANLEMLERQNRLIISGKRVEDSKVSYELDYSWEENYRLPDPQSLDFFLIERYLFYSFGTDLKMGRVHHQPYQITDVKLNNWNEDSLKLKNFQFKTLLPDYSHFSPGVNVDLYRLKSVY